MEKSNELNKFLSYIHMGMSVFRIYYQEAKDLNDEKLVNKIVEIQEIFKHHEEVITRMITEMNEEATDSLTLAGIMGVYKEKMKTFNCGFSLCISALKATNMGMLSAIKFLNENKKLPSSHLGAIVDVINDYGRIQEMLRLYIIDLIF